MTDLYSFEAHVEVKGAKPQAEGVRGTVEEALNDVGCQWAGCLSLLSFYVGGVVEGPSRLGEENRERLAALRGTNPAGGREKPRPTIVCLCGSTRFHAAFRQANYDETLAGRIVLTLGCDLRSDDELFGELPPERRDEIKTALDELHLRKIDLADEILVLNVGGYVGESTRREVEYARKTGKQIRWLEGQP